MKQNLDDAVSLFPFLDIMACLIGILVLLITAVTLAQISRNVEDMADAQSAAEAERRVHQYRLATRELTVDQEERQQLEALLRQLQELQEQLDQVTAEIEQLQAEQRRDPAQEEVDRYAQQIQQAQQRLEQLQEQRAELREQLDELETVPDPEVQIVPSGTGYDLTPTFIECTADSIIVHDPPEPVRIPVRGLSSNQTYQQVLDRVKDQPHGTIVFLIRPDGVSTYNTARHIARRQYVTNGKLAVAGHGKLDLSLFQ